MFQLSQWVTWEPVQFPGEPKPRKIPCGGYDAHNPINWMSYEQARSASKNIGFVFTETDPYFFLDIDHALQVDGSWSPLAIQICQMFPGAYIEVSYSGDGLHIIAQGKIPDGFKHKNKALGLEIYDKLRYAAITGISATGTPDINHQANLNSFVTGYMEQSIEMTHPLEWTTAPRPDWNGPEDDDELIKKMLSARPSADMLWNGKATIEDLWTGNIEKFKECYPDNSERGYDATAPDMALATHLAFWTGANCDRIERLMWRSALRRDKWTTHPTYLRGFTIRKAVASCQNVYSDPRQQPAPPSEPSATLPANVIINEPVVRTGAQILHADAQIEYFKGCVYIVNTHRILRPNGTLVSPEQFKVIYGGFLFSMDYANQKTTKCAWEVFTKSQAVTFPIVEGVLFRPEIEPLSVIEREGLTYINTFVPAPVRRVQGDPTPFLDLLQRLFPDDRDRLIILSYMAACIQYMGVKFQWCPIIQGEEGNGKSFLIRVLIRAIGDRHSHLVNPKDIANKFNAWIEGKVFAGVEEVYISDRRDVIDALKIMVTNDRLEIQPKGGNQYMGDNRANFMMNSNHQDAIKKTKNDRRYAPFFTPQQSYDDIQRWGMGGDYFPNLYNWAKQDGYAIIAEYLSTFEIPDEFNPATKCHRAPETTSTTSAINISKGAVEQEIQEVIDQGKQGFRNGWISSIALEELLIKIGKNKVIVRNKRTELLTAMGYEKIGRATFEIAHERGRPLIYKHVTTPTNGDFTMEYMKAQGYATV